MTAKLKSIAVSREVDRGSFDCLAFTNSDEIFLLWVLSLKAQLQLRNMAPVHFAPLAVTYHRSLCHGVVSNVAHTEAC